MRGPASPAHTSLRRAVRIALLVLAAPIAIVGVNVLASNFSRASNCGGNSAALHACSTLARIPQFALKEQPQSELSFNSALRILGPKEFPSRPLFLSDAEILIRSPVEPWPRPPQAKIVVAVCMTPFSNVRIHSQWNVFASNEAHAVGYSDGSAGLIPVSEFAQLDLSGFVPIGSWKPDW